jgi:hypothetical protein
MSHGGRDIQRSHGEVTERSTGVAASDRASRDRSQRVPRRRSKSSSPARLTFAVCSTKFDRCAGAQHLLTSSLEDASPTVSEDAAAVVISPSQPCRQPSRARDCHRDRAAFERQRPRPCRADASSAWYRGNDHASDIRGCSPRDASRSIVFVRRALLAIVMLSGCTLFESRGQQPDAGPGSDEATAIEASPRDVNLEILVVASSAAVLVGPIRGARRRRRNKTL